MINLQGFKFYNMFWYFLYLHKLKVEQNSVYKPKSIKTVNQPYVPYSTAFIMINEFYSVYKLQITHVLPGKGNASVLNIKQLWTRTMIAIKNYIELFRQGLRVIKYVFEIWIQRMSLWQNVEFDLINIPKCWNEWHDWFLPVFTLSSLLSG